MIALPGTDPATDLARAHRDLQARYRGIIDRLPAVLYIDGVNDGDTMVDVGPGILDLLGIDPRGVARDSEGWRRCVHPDDLDRVVAPASARGDRRSLPRAIPRDPSRTVAWCGSAKRQSALTTSTAPRSSGSASCWTSPSRFARSESLHDAQTQVRRARRADPRDRLRGRRRRAHDDQLRQPADRSAAGHHTRRSTSTIPTCGPRTCTPRTGTERVADLPARGEPPASRSRSSTAWSRETGACCGSATSAVVVHDDDGTALSSCRA